MKIAIIADPLDNQNAGVHIYTKGMVDALLQYDQVNEYILIRQKLDPALPSKAQQVIIPNFPWLPGFASLRLFFLIPLFLRRLKVNAVVEPAHFGPFNLPKRIKRITIIHDLTPLLFPQYHRWHSQLLQRLFLKRILQKTHLILTVSQNTAMDLKRLFPFTAPKATIIYPGRDSFFQPNFDTSPFQEFSIKVPYFLSVGTIEPRKNLILLLQAYQQFRTQSTQQVDLVIIGGKGWKYEAFYEVLEQHPYRNNIYLLGYVDKAVLPAFYTRAVATIYPSLYEGFGLPVLEAMACGGLVICSNRSSLPEVGGKAAFYFNPNDLDALIDLMVHTSILSQREEQVALSLKQATSFSWERYAQVFIKAIHT